MPQKNFTSTNLSYSNANNVVKNPKSLRNRKLLSFSDGINRFTKRKKGTESMRLTRLWLAWSEVLGEDLAELVKPLGNKDRTLVLAVEDSIMMQEAHYQLQTIMRLVNEYLWDIMGENFFVKAQLTLPKGKQGLDSYKGIEQPVVYEYIVPEPPGLDTVEEKLNPNSPVMSCFKAYYNYFKTRETKK
ncbi:DUF721 domain-containing protein [Desulfovibrio litoralis]|uniref:DUF721 domain-containing protein n=1 Tax=Desulfovibrio litoralis DSM 11393 TaxID=1121455 RepID=A0A1M7SCJ6_9BACT|nr:DUF721 domain-containing protein [Desulfovibrio litoralis]SHN56225.1 Protein of unknown function [Desulfovibrio litoralis DSM 11393]